MIGLESFVRRWWYRKIHWTTRNGIASARVAWKAQDLPRLGLALVAVAYGINKKRSQPKRIYSTSIDTGESFEIRVLRGRKPIAEARVDR